MKVLISVIIPVYNSEKYLEKCIESIRNQTLKDIEMIFINDGSKDNSLGVLKEYQKIDNRIIVIDQQNTGPSVARNKGIKIAKGEYLSFIDSDDWIDLNMYESMYNTNKGLDLDMIICDRIIVGDNNKYEKALEINEGYYNKSEIDKEIIPRLFDNSNFNSMANKIFKSKIIKDKNILLDEKIDYAEDWKFNIDFFKYVKSIGYISQGYYYYRRGHESSTTKYSENTLERMGIWLYNNRKKYANKFNVDKYAGSKELFNVMYHCIICETKKRRIKSVINILNTKEIQEMLIKLDCNDLNLKEKIIFYFSTRKMYRTLFFYLSNVIILNKFKLMLNG